MSAWWRGIGWDLRLLHRARTAPVIVLTILLLGGIAAWNGHAAAQRWHSDNDTARLQAQRQRDELAAKIERGQESVAPYAAKGLVLLPVAPLVDVASGRSDLEPRAAEATTFGQAHLLFRDYQIGSPIALALGRFDLAFVVQVVLPLFVIVLGYGVGAGREDTLSRMLAVQGASVRRILFTRLVARALLIGMPVALVLAAAAAASWSIADGSGQRGIRLLIAVALIGGYGAFWWALVGWTASFRWRESRMLATLLTCWIGLVLVVPALVGAVARQIHASPSRFALIAQARVAEIAATRRTEALLGEYTHDHPDLQGRGQDLPAWAKSVFVVARAVDDAVAPLMRRFDDALQRQQEAVSQWQYASPALALHQGLAAVAGTDERRQLDFRQAAQSYFASFRERTGQLMLSGQPLMVAQLDSLPVFRHVERPPSALVRDAAGPLAFLWGVAVMLLAWTFARSAREEPANE